MIAQIQDDHGVSLIHHEDKANHLWCSFKNRMGFSNNVSMDFDLGSLVLINDDGQLGSLASPFSVAEIDNIIKIMPTNKAPGPDGFNGMFIKKCWPIIQEDIYKLFFDFFDNKVSLAPINGSHIVLVPKHSNLVLASNYRPISLLNCCVKMITKHRTIQDCLA